MPKSVVSPVSRYVAVCAAALSIVALPGLRAQSGSSAVKAPASAPVKVAMLDLAFYGKRANDIFPGDTAMADTATAVMRNVPGAGSAGMTAPEKIPIGTLVRPN